MLTTARLPPPQSRDKEAARADEAESQLKRRQMVFDEQLRQKQLKLDNLNEILSATPHTYRPELLDQAHAPRPPGAGAGGAAGGAAYGEEALLPAIPAAIVRAEEDPVKSADEVRASRPASSRPVAKKPTFRKPPRRVREQ